MIFAALTACEKEENRYSPSLQGSLTASMGGDYRSALYFDLSTGGFSKITDRDLWSLSVEWRDEQAVVYLNSANFMFARPTGDTDFVAISDTSLGQGWKYDRPDGSPDHTAVGSWWNTDKTSRREVIILDLGFDVSGNSLGYRKFQILEERGDTLRFRHARLDGSEDRIGEVFRLQDHRRSEFDLPSNRALSIEPESDRWDMLFTQYTDFDLTDEGDTLSYLVRGVLTDPDKLRVAKLIGADWEAIALSEVLDLDFSTAQNAIGYDWKRFSLDDGRYTVETDWIYILDAGSKGYFKLRFLDYYDEQGERGHAQFELRGL
jgi:hypothetical protein